MSGLFATVGGAVRYDVVEQRGGATLHMRDAELSAGALLEF